MTETDFKNQIAWINQNLIGKTISGASFEEWGMGYGVTLQFSDGTKCTVTPEYDEGFRFVPNK